MKNYSKLTLLAALLTCSTLSQASAQSPFAGVRSGGIRPAQTSACPGPTARHSAPSRAYSGTQQCNNAARPTRTAEGVPIRYVDVPIPNYGYGYGYGFGYGSYFYSGGSGQPAPLDPNSSSLRRTAPRQAPRRDISAPDPKVARDHTYRKLLDEFSRENSVGGKVYLKDGSDSWLLEFTGQPEYDNYAITVPCIGKTRDGFARRVLLSLKVSGDEIVSSEIEL